MIRAQSIHLRLGGRSVLTDCSLDLAAGETVAVIGPYGAGKSSLLGLLSGALSPERGEITLDGRPIADIEPRVLARRRAVLEQAPDLAFPFRCLDLVLLGRDPHLGVSARDENLVIAEAAMAETDSLHLAGRLYPTLSGGERQRIQLARALAQIWPEGGKRDAASTRPCFLLLDEPTNNLDIGHQQALVATVRRMADKGLGVVAILHDPNLAALAADRLIVLNGGQVVADGGPASVLTPELIEDVFGVKASIIAHPETGRPCMLPKAATPPETAVSAQDVIDFPASMETRRKMPCSSP